MSMPSFLQVKSVTDLRERTVDVLDQLKEKGLFYIFSRSKPVAVMMSVDEYERLKNGYDLYISDASKTSQSGSSIDTTQPSVPETAEVGRVDNLEEPEHWVEEVHIRREHE